VLDFRARHDEQLQQQLPGAAGAIQDLPVEIDIGCLEGSLPVHFEGKHLGQVGFSGQRQLDLLAQD
jgi:hypothetical protein